MAAVYVTSFLFELRLEVYSGVHRTGAVARRRHGGPGQADHLGIDQDDLGMVDVGEELRSGSRTNLGRQRLDPTRPLRSGRSRPADRSGLLGLANLSS